MVFCNKEDGRYYPDYENVTILILVDGFLQFIKERLNMNNMTVTILILVDGFLQFGFGAISFCFYICHNPYFSRWFSAIWNYIQFHKLSINVTILILVDGFLQ